MSTIDPLDRANILIRFGRTSEAIASLKAASCTHPHRADVKLRLAELQAQVPASSSQRLRVWLHSAVAWLLLAGSLAAAISPLYFAALGVIGRSDVHPSGTIVLLWVCLAVAALAGAVYLGCLLFLHSWFIYLRFAGQRDVVLVERALPSSMQISLFEPHYSRIRDRYLSSGHVT